MPCFKPLLAVDYGVNPDTGKHHIRFIKTGEYDSLEDAREGHRGNLMFLPCNKCVGCAQDYARSWQGRIMCEYESRKKKKILVLVFLLLLMLTILPMFL